MNRVVKADVDARLAKRQAFNRILRSVYQPAMAAATLLVVLAASSADGTRATSKQRGTERRIDASSTVGAVRPPSDIALDRQEVEGILGKEVRSSADEKMGRIINVIIDRNVHPRAAIIDFGGFLGIGSRKLAVDWNLLHFGPAGDGIGRMTVELTADQVRAAPEFREGKPMVVLDGAPAASD